MNLRKNQLGFILILIGMLLFSAQDLLIKLIVKDTSLLQIIVFRSFIGFFILIFYLISKKKKINLSSSFPKIAIARGFLFFIGFLCFYISLSKITLAEAVSLFFISPLFMTIFSKIILKNKVGIHRLIAIIIGFLGTLLIIKPQFINFNWFMLLPIYCAFTYSLSMILAKKTSQKDDLFQQLFHIYIGAILLGTLLTIFFKYTSLFVNFNNLQILNITWHFTEIKMILPIILISIFGSFGTIFLMLGYRMGSPVVNAPAEYILLVFALINGLIFFNDQPDFFSIIGMTLIFLSGIFIFIRENIRGSLVATKTSLRS